MRIQEKKTMRIRLLSCLSVLFFALPLLGQQVVAPCIAVAVQADGQAFAPTTASFSATQILDVTATAILRLSSRPDFATGDHVMEFRFKSPDGHLYQSVSVPFTTNAASAGKEQKVNGYPLPVARQAARAVTYQRVNQLGVSATLPVAGTLIIQNSLYGRWTVEATVDGEKSRCSSSASFSLITK